MVHSGIEPESKMDNQEDIWDALQSFEKKKLCEIPPLLEQYLTRVAKTGQTIFPWTWLKPVFVAKLEIVMHKFNEDSPTDHLPSISNAENVKFDDMRSRILLGIDKFNGTPFTIQRLCELVTEPQKHYKRPDKFLRGVEKNVQVVSTVDPYGKKIVSESKMLINGLDLNGHMASLKESCMSPVSKLPPPPPGSPVSSTSWETSSDINTPLPMNITCDESTDDTVKSSSPHSPQPSGSGDDGTTVSNIPKLQPISESVEDKPETNTGSVKEEGGSGDSSDSDESKPCDISVPLEGHSPRTSTPASADNVNSNNNTDDVKLSLAIDTSRSTESNICETPDETVGRETKEALSDDTTLEAVTPADSSVSDLPDVVKDSIEEKCEENEVTVTTPDDSLPLQKESAVGTEVTKSVSDTAFSESDVQAEMPSSSSSSSSNGSSSEVDQTTSDDVPAEHWTITLTELDNIKSIHDNDDDDADLNTVSASAVRVSSPSVPPALESVHDVDDEAVSRDEDDVSSSLVASETPKSTDTCTTESTTDITPSSSTVSSSQSSSTETSYIKLDISESGEITVKQDENEMNEGVDQLPDSQTNAEVLPELSSECSQSSSLPVTSSEPVSSSSSSSSLSTTNTESVGTSSPSDTTTGASSSLLSSPHEKVDDVMMDTEESTSSSVSEVHTAMDAQDSVVDHHNIAAVVQSSMGSSSSTEEPMEED